MRISDWSSDVCSSDLVDAQLRTRPQGGARHLQFAEQPREGDLLLVVDRLVVEDGDAVAEIGRASGRERECQYGWVSGGAVSYKKKITRDRITVNAETDRS